MEPTKDRFSIQIRDDGVFLVVTATSEGSPETDSPLDSNLVFEALANNKIELYDNAAVISAIKFRTGLPVKIAEPPKPKPEAEISVFVSRDRMDAFLQIEIPEGAERPDKDRIMSRFERSGIRFGILPAAIDLALRQPNLRVLCAKGTPAENGTDASIEYKVDLEKRGKPAETEDGGVDFKNLGNFINIAKDQLLAEKKPATPGVPGTDVCGNPVHPRPGKDIPLQPGSNVHVEEGTKLVATAGGNLSVQGMKLSISPILNIKENVDLSTGNIDFAGDVVIKGSVTEGFFVKAGGNVDISGMVSGGNVQGCNITVRQGILGLNKGVITATGSVMAKFIENATVEAEGDILVQDVVLHSHLSAGKKIRVEGRRGQIVGGVAAAGEEIMVKSAGSSSTTPTELHAGVNPKLREEYFSLRKEIKATETNLDQIKKALFTLRSVDQCNLPPEKKEMLLKITRAQFLTQGQVEKMHVRLGELEKSYEELRDGQIKVADYLFPGVKLVIGPLVKPIQEVFRFVVFYADAGEIKFRPLK